MSHVGLRRSHGAVEPEPAGDWIWASSVETSKELGKGFKFNNPSPAAYQPRHLREWPLNLSAHICKMGKWRWRLVLCQVEPGSSYSVGMGLLFRCNFRHIVEQSGFAT